MHELRRVRALLKQGGREQRFADVIVAVRRRHGLKRNFMAMLSAARW